MRNNSSAFVSGISPSALSWFLLGDLHDLRWRYFYHVEELILNILKNTCFVDNIRMSDDAKKADRVWKTRLWLSKPQENFFVISPEEFHLVDKILVPLKSRLLLQHYGVLNFGVEVV